MFEISLQKPKYFLFLFCLAILTTSCENNKEENLPTETPDNIKSQAASKTPKTLTNITVSTQKPIIETASLSAFEKCTITENLLKVREYLIKSAKPLQSYEGYLTYKIDTNFHNLPIKKVIFGVCFKDEPLVQSCSFIEDIAFIIDSPFDKVKSELKKSTDIDFSVVKRANLNDSGDVANGPTLRPFLYKGGDGSTVLHCDTGGL